MSERWEQDIVHVIETLIDPGKASEDFESDYEEFTGDNYPKHPSPEQVRLCAMRLLLAYDLHSMEDGWYCGPRPIEELISEAIERHG